MDYYNWPLEKRAYVLYFLQHETSLVSFLVATFVVYVNLWFWRIKHGMERRMMIQTVSMFVIWSCRASSYYLCIVQYISKLDTEYLRTLVKELKEKDQQLSKKKFHFQLADEQV